MVEWLLVWSTARREGPRLGIEGSGAFMGCEGILMHQSLQLCKNGIIF